LLIVLQEMQVRLAYFASLDFEEDDPRLTSSFLSAAEQVEAFIDRLAYWPTTATRMKDASSSHIQRNAVTAG
jgi:hypothetical protein